MFEKSPLLMFVEDSNVCQFLYRKLIENLDVDLMYMQAHDGQEALDMLSNAENLPSVVFLDIDMPRMDGHSFLSVYEETYGDKAPPVMILTSSESDEDRLKTMNHDCVQRFFMKPLKASDVEWTLEYLKKL